VTRCALVVTTYERPDALARVLESVATQSRPPDELAIADDGSGATTGEVVHRYAASVNYPVRHAWQPHQGFRAGRARNVAIAGCTSDFVILVDGDMLLHPRFVLDHLALARPDYYSQGVRIPLDEAATRRALEPGSPLPTWLDRGQGFLRRSYAWRQPSLARALRGAANRIVAVKACNQGFWREDLVAVNGFDESMTGWGAEDKELCARLENAGVRRQTLLWAAPAWHLHHPRAPRTSAEANRRQWRETVRSGRTRCEAGLDGHAPR